jgi:hypothetical protein
MDRRVLDRLRRNIDGLGVVESCIIWPGDVTRGLARRLDALGEKVDLAFVDPPYADLRQWDWPEAEAALFAPLAAHLAPDGVVVLRMPDDAAGPKDAAGRIAVAGLVCRREKRFGNMVLALMGLEKKRRNREPGTRGKKQRNQEPGTREKKQRNQEPGIGKRKQRNRDQSCFFFSGFRVPITRFRRFTFPATGY